MFVSPIQTKLEVIHKQRRQMWDGPSAKLGENRRGEGVMKRKMDRVASFYKKSTEKRKKNVDPTHLVTLQNRTVILR